MPYNLKKAKLWTQKEDKALISLISKHGLSNWKKITTQLFKDLHIKRSTKQCRDRWLNHLKKGLSSKPLSISEQNCLVELIQEFGTSWTKICEFLPGRSENQVKNFMNATVRRNIRRYNKFKPENEKIKGNSLKLLECPEIKKILLCGKEVKRKEFVGFKLSKDALDFAEAVAQEDRDQSGELSLISELDNILMLLLDNIKG